MSLKMIDHDEEQLVEFIYQATITPQIWPELLKKLHEFVFSHFEIADHQQLNDKLYQTIFKAMFPLTVVECGAACFR